VRVEIPVIKNPDFAIPSTFGRLADLAHNLWWTWDATASGLWRQLNPEMWSRYHNPVEILTALQHEDWERFEQSAYFQDLATESLRRFDAYMQADDTWFDRHYGDAAESVIAYLCAEYGIHSSLPLYSGGLGVLAGDHAKSASDLGLPFVGTGLAYRRGYFRQHLDVDGTQQHYYPTLDVTRLPLEPVQAPGGGQLTIKIDFPGREIDVAVWSVSVGRIQLLLMDTDLASNEPADRPITHTLYIRGREMRFCQELILGLGSVRIMEALGIEPTVWHVNEGHAAMSILERLAGEVGAGASLDEARAAVKAKTAFTLHTPVPAGNETFDRSLVEKYLAPWPQRVGAEQSILREIGWSGREGDGRFDLGALAIRHASVVNGVSAKHAEVASRDWSHLIPDGVIGITNGVHAPTWVARDLRRSFTELVGSDWAEGLVESPDTARKIVDMTDRELWERHVDRKEVFGKFVRRRLRTQYARHGASPDELRAVDLGLPANRLTIGFARRFATYKRATLLFHNVPWLQSILTNPDRPVQFVFAGKAHPADRHGQALIQHIVELSQTAELHGHIYVLEDYDLRMARFMMQGVDVWLNNPRIPQEASGTSGMKVAMNGGLNLSVADGWWIEGANERNGWLFGGEHENPDHGAQDEEDAVALYTLLQEEVVPRYYERGEDGVPTEWVAMMKEAIASTIHQFSTHRMVAEYVAKAYLRA